MTEENEQKKQFLRRYLLAKASLRRYDEQLSELRLKQLPSGISYSDMPKGGGTTDLSGYAAKFYEIDQEIIKARYECLKEFQVVRNAIESMETEEYKAILSLRYLKGDSWEHIADREGYTYRHVTRLHGLALEEFKMS